MKTGRGGYASGHDTGGDGGRLGGRSEMPTTTRQSAARPPSRPQPLVSTLHASRVTKRIDFSIEWVALGCVALFRRLGPTACCRFPRFWSPLVPRAGPAHVELWRLGWRQGSSSQAASGWHCYCESLMVQGAPQRPRGRAWSPPRLLWQQAPMKANLYTVQASPKLSPFPPSRGKARSIS